MENIRVRIAKNVKRIRNKQKISQAELGYRAGLHENYIGRIENVKSNISVETLEKLSVALGVKIGELLK